MLQCNNICKRYGGLQALLNVSFDIRQDIIMGLIGPNGAGKTTLLNLISGFIKPNSGAIIFQGENISRMSPHRIARRGIARTYQHTKVFKEFTVLENLEIADIDPEEIEKVIEKFGLYGKKSRLGEKLSLFDQKKLEIAMALSLKPKLLLLDEPTAGFTLAEKESLKELVEFAKERWSFSMILIEHDVKFTLDLSDEVMVLCEGRVLAQGTPEEIVKDQDVVENYLGRSAI